VGICKPSPFLAMPARAGEFARFFVDRLSSGDHAERTESEKVEVPTARASLTHRRRTMKKLLGRVRA
jgi:hypothetical protein